ncbi:MarR family winged helix-turn-helix transcriptional regulator [Ferrimicrobium acidiphilum]|uniref:HTH-type transcriptional repressor NicR n=1 Tax=Ferrimicrobium acidiphilum DSM 19497 TaxID=1121877 RepID=A0A0D8FQS8_9ACTN|nr:MarR family transcriptional regulator [Ferrimicrobium acidiphilum]KJE75628.1 HTH-type transcriptional repressor NicR [Ferrimicrobium acidiphilum DSM 19497]
MDGDEGEEFGLFEELRPFGEIVAFMLSILGAMELRSFRVLMTSVSLEPRTFGVLRALADVGSAKQHHLSQLAQVPASTMVAILDELEAADLVSRDPDPGDRRAHQVSLTAQGRDLIERATALAWRHEQEITAGLSANDRKALLDALSLVFRNLKRPG